MFEAAHLPARGMGGFGMGERDFAVRPFVLDGCEAVFALRRRTSGLGLNGVDDSRGGIAAYPARNPHTCFVVCGGDGGIAGAALSGRGGRRGFVYHACAAEEARRRGAGTALVNAAREALKAEGIGKAALVVFERNEGGNAFWERLGWTTRPDLLYRNKALVEVEGVGGRLAEPGKRKDYENNN